MFVTNWISPTKIQKISEITNFFRHYFLSRTEAISVWKVNISTYVNVFFTMDGDTLYCMAVSV